MEPLESPLLAVNDRLIVRRLETPAFTGAGLLIPDSAKDAIIVYEGVLLDVGPAANKDNAGRFQVGAHVRFNKYSGLQVDDRDELLLSMTAYDILGIVPTAKNNA